MKNIIIVGDSPFSKSVLVALDGRQNQVILLRTRTRAVDFFAHANNPVIVPFPIDLILVEWGSAKDMNSFEFLRQASSIVKPFPRTWLVVWQFTCKEISKKISSRAYGLHASLVVQKDELMKTLMETAFLKSQPGSS